MSTACVSQRGMDYVRVPFLRDAGQGVRDARTW